MMSYGPARFLIVIFRVGWFVEQRFEFLHLLLIWVEQRFEFQQRFVV